MDDTTTTSFFGKFTSPWRNLAWSFHKSRENWKKKFQELKGEHKRLQNQVRDVRKSREEWRSKAEQTQTTTDSLRAEITRLEAALAAAKAPSEKKGYRAPVCQCPQRRRYRTSDRHAASIIR